ncbi:hypothetical protein EX30DRAFT_351405 [Ascodesmis nigricans]|uniref:Uncharacterized protein n=1 Tax=Ascodesmis nigricans TaxID=341454 RepID=A0A4S2MMA2_9PEZI|nr:hypothetical protein EX30DRAFT_351405 [Ascodesmis nigricans]
MSQNPLAYDPRIELTQIPTDALHDSLMSLLQTTATSEPGLPAAALLDLHRRIVDHLFLTAFSDTPSFQTVFHHLFPLNPSSPILDPATPPSPEAQQELNQKLVTLINAYDRLGRRQLLSMLHSIYGRRLPYPMFTGIHEQLLLDIPYRIYREKISAPGGTVEVEVDGGLMHPRLWHVLNCFIDHHVELFAPVRITLVDEMGLLRVYFEEEKEEEREVGVTGRVSVGARVVKHCALGREEWVGYLVEGFD